MALQANYNFRGITIPNAYIRIERVFGGKKEGWNSVVAVYPEKPSAAAQEFDAEGNEIPFTPIEPITTFNAGATYDPANPNAMALIYAKLKVELGASDV